jgi:Flp pilus assembly pilin Flp
MLELIVRAQTLGTQLKNRLRREDGQTSSEYTIIAGIVVIIIIAILGIFRTQLTAAATSIMGKITGAVQ